MFSYNYAYTIISDILVLKESKHSLYSTKNLLIINLKGKLRKLQKPFGAEELVNSTAIIHHSNMLKPYMGVLVLSVLNIQQNIA